MIDLALADKLAANYQGTLPFPHVAIDNFLDDMQTLEEVALELARLNDWGWDDIAGEQQVKKLFMPWNQESVGLLPQRTKYLLQWLNGPTFLAWLTSLTGIPNLIADPNYVGGGAHKIMSGGKLSVHTDFALHPWERRLYRRLNLLLYLNKEWQASWGGSLQLFDFESKKQTHDFQPLFNRAIIFNTTTVALHGHPGELRCPDDRFRLSLALYYFTVEEPEAPGDSRHAVWYPECVAQSDLPRGATWQSS
jgi:Rps23 Pro-64 3,4-dihydroxylase Tpa1-like proline 4-hydroxylase